MASGMMSKEIKNRMASSLFNLSAASKVQGGKSVGLDYGPGVGPRSILDFEAAIF